MMPRQAGPGLFDEPEVEQPAVGEWAGMPEFVQEDRRPWKRLIVNFATPEDYEDFARLVGQRLGPRTDNIWHPAVETIKFDGVKRYAASTARPPASPIYIVSKGRPDRCLTSKALDIRGVPHYVVVEEQERDLYASALGATATVLVLDPAYQREYDPCDDLGDTKSKGPGPARNFAWEHSLAAGAAWHWVMDDNISRFHRLNRNLKVPTADGTIFVAMEDFVDRYENVGMAGPNYHGLAKQRDPLPPFVLNTRIYSCNLIRNELPFRWRGRYNEDTDLSLRMLKAGWVTVEFNAFLQEKVMTSRVRGGNTQVFYENEGTRPKSDMLAALHPDVASVVWKFNRWHHQVDYSPFRKNALRLRPDAVVPEGTDDFGMRYEERDGEEWVALNEAE